MGRSLTTTRTMGTIGVLVTTLVFLVIYATGAEHLAPGVLVEETTSINPIPHSNAYRTTDVEASGTAFTLKFFAPRVRFTKASIMLINEEDAPGEVIISNRQEGVLGIAFHHQTTVSNGVVRAYYRFEDNVISHAPEATFILRWQGHPRLIARINTNGDEGHAVLGPLGQEQIIPVTDVGFSVTYDSYPSLLGACCLQRTEGGVAECLEWTQDDCLSQLNQTLPENLEIDPDVLVYPCGVWQGFLSQCDKETWGFCRNKLATFVGSNAKPERFRRGPARL